MPPHITRVAPKRKGLVMRALRVAAGLMIGLLGLLGISFVIQTVAPPGGSEGATIATSARAPDTAITAAAMVALITTALLITYTMQVLFKQRSRRSTLKSRTRSAIHQATSWQYDLRLTATERAGARMRSIYSALRQALGLGSHAHKASVPFPCATT